MAAPNIVGVTSIYGKTAVQNVDTTATSIVENTAASGKVLKINTLIISNITGSIPVDISVDVYKNSNSYSIASTIAVPADATLIVLSKDTSIYLEEGDSLRAVASATNSLQAVCSYEEIS